MRQIIINFYFRKLVQKILNFILNKYINYIIHYLNISPSKYSPPDKIQ